MSVINQMLVELERRRASGAELNRIPNHVRALSGAPAASHNAKPLVMAVVLAAAVLAVAWWWWNPGRQVVTVAPTPVAEKPRPVAALTPDQEAVETIAHRMSLDLEHVPEPANPQQESAVSGGGVSTAAVIAQEPRPVAPKPAVPPAAPARTAPMATKAAEVAAPRAEISKQVREPTPQQRADAEYARGVNALHQGRSGEARSAFESALGAFPAQHAARQALVGVLLDSRQYAEAERILQEGLDLAPSQYGFAMALARLQVEQGDLDAGVKTLARSIDYAGSSPEYAAFYAGLLQRQQKHTEAVDMFQRALKSRGNSGIWLLGMGLSLDALGRSAEAQEAYRRAKASGNLPGDLAAFADQRLR